MRDAHTILFYGNEPYSGRAAVSSLEELLYQTDTKNLEYYRLR